MTCWLSIAIGQDVIWPVRGEASIGVEVQIDDLLSYLTEFWKPLMLRQVYPLPVHPSRPSDFRRLAEQRWTELPSQLVEREEHIVSAFEEAHDLSLAFGGQYGLPNFWMMRSGEHMVVETSGRVWKIPFNTARKSLRVVGDQIYSRLREINGDKWDLALRAWSDRDRSDDAHLLAWSTGIPTELARTLIDNRDLKAPRDFDDAINDNDELRIAARIAGALPLTQIRTILAIARTFQKLQADALKELMESCVAHIENHFAHSIPFKQGEAAALFVRERLSISNDGKVDVASLVKNLGVNVRIEAAGPPTFDGLAIWGEAFGPGVFLNQNSQRVIAQDYFGPINENNSIRVTLAHELCHLLLDSEHAFSAVEVLNARMPPGVEARAKSFAGQFLLPTHAAARVWEGANRPRDYEPLKNLVSELSKEFGVTRSVAAWKLEHGANSHNVDLGCVLDLVAPYR